MHIWYMYHIAPLKLRKYKSTKYFGGSYTHSNVSLCEYFGYKSVRHRISFCAERKLHIGRVTLRSLYYAYKQMDTDSCSFF